MRRGNESQLRLNGRNYPIRWVQRMPKLRASASGAGISGDGPGDEGVYGAPSRLFICLFVYLFVGNLTEERFHLCYWMWPFWKKNPRNWLLEYDFLHLPLISGFSQELGISA